MAPDLLQHPENPKTDLSAAGKGGGAGGSSHGAHSCFRAQEKGGVKPREVARVARVASFKSQRPFKSPVVFIVLCVHPHTSYKNSPLLSQIFQQRRNSRKPGHVKPGTSVPRMLGLVGRGPAPGACTRRRPSAGRGAARGPPSPSCTFPVPLSGWGGTAGPPTQARFC